MFASRLRSSRSLANRLKINSKIKGLKVKKDGIGVEVECLSSLYPWS